MMNRALVVACLFFSAAVSSLGRAEQGPMVVLELFTSQGCYSCPPAEELLAEQFVDRQGILALELHVDYWDSLVYRGSSWKDPFSSADFTQRQRRYAQKYRRNPFTPQMIIQGAFSSSGSNRNKIEYAIEQAQELKFAQGWEIGFTQGVDGAWLAEVASAGESAEAIAVIYTRQQQTEVTGGENKGKLLHNHNVVTQFKPVGLVSSGDVVEIGTVKDGQGCAVILQRANQGAMLGAWTCPQHAQQS